MPFDRSPLSAAEIKNLFETPIQSAPNTYDLALVLGGTVSAGSFTAGAMDFLIEALDAWTELRDQDDPAAPKHKVNLRIVVGTSGGGVNAGIAARSLAYQFPHVTRAIADDPGATGNPFFTVWTKLLALRGFLETEDLAGGVRSLLDGGPIDRGAAYLVSFEGPRKRRSWVSDPLRVIVTVTNLRGVPYKTDFGPGMSETFVNHADHARFAVFYGTNPAANLRPDEFSLGFDGVVPPQGLDWAEFSQFARATAAFPIGFPARPLSRPTAHYRYRAVALPPDESGVSAVRALLPDWDALIEPGVSDVPAAYDFVTVDGGATDNEPIELGRTFLSGLNGRNPRKPLESDRGVVLIDPFAGRTDLGPLKLSSLLNGAGAVVNSLVGQARYDTSDILLAADPDVYSRFMLTPSSANKKGAAAIASSGLGAFIGFASEAFMRHDYLLGRQNCQEFLRSVFVLDENNPVFEGVWTDRQKNKHRVPDNGRTSLPLVPLLGTAALPQDLDQWPQGALDPDTYRDAIEARYKAIVKEVGQGGLFSSVLAWVGAEATQGCVADYVIDAMNRALKSADLAKDMEFEP